MQLPVNPPIAPMLAKLTRELPSGDDYIFEPKWDGFRCVVFRDQQEIELYSRNERPITQYFPELIAPLRRNLPRRSVVDGEVIIAQQDRLDFDALLQRIHPAESRIEKLARETPAWFVAFDLLALGNRNLCGTPFRARRARLERALAKARPPVITTPATAERQVAADWFERFEGAGFDGVIAKHVDQAYVPGKREMLKIKHLRTADVVVGGFRAHRHGGVGSLLLGLYDSSRTLHHVGIATGFSIRQRHEILAQLEPLTKQAGAAHPWLRAHHANVNSVNMNPEQRVPGGPSRWSRERDSSWQPLRPERVAEVSYDHLQGVRFRHATRFLRWRDDREPLSCRYDQLEEAPPAELTVILQAASAGA